jgi:hypothetical protein
MGAQSGYSARLRCSSPLSASRRSVSNIGTP